MYILKIYFKEDINEKYLSKEREVMFNKMYYTYIIRMDTRDILDRVYLEEERNDLLREIRDEERWMRNKFHKYDEYENHKKYYIYIILEN